MVIWRRFVIQEASAAEFSSSKKNVQDLTTNPVAIDLILKDILWPEWLRIFMQTFLRSFIFAAFVYSHWGVRIKKLYQRGT